MVEDKIKLPHLADDRSCTGCLACIDSCPVGALEPILNEERHLTYSLNTNNCIGCLKCEKVCTIQSNFEYGVNDVHLSKLYAGWNNEESLRKDSSSGGIFSALAKKIIENGGVVAGASMQNFDVVHKIIDKKLYIKDLQGSKYTQSNTHGIYKSIKEHLNNGRLVLFTGLGCQIAGLLTYLGTKKYDNLLTVDLICGGVPSKALIEKFKEQYKDKYRAINSFRNKQKYEFSVIKMNGEIEILPLNEKPLPLCGFYTELTNRHSCYNCKFAFVHRKADITIGDYWGDTDYIEQHVKGISAVVVHSPKGEKWLREASITLKEGRWSIFLVRNFRMADGFSAKGIARRRQNLAYAIKHYNYEHFLIDYANYATIFKPWTWIIKLTRHVFIKYNAFYGKKIIRDILDKNK